jgi:hypothetical protein
VRQAIEDLDVSKLDGLLLEAKRLPQKPKILRAARMLRDKLRNAADDSNQQSQTRSLPSNAIDSVLKNKDRNQAAGNADASSNVLPRASLFDDAHEIQASDSVVTTETLGQSDLPADLQAELDGKSNRVKPETTSEFNIDSGAKIKQSSAGNVNLNNNNNNHDAARTAEEPLTPALIERMMPVDSRFKPQDFVIAVVACDRPHMLTKTLESLLNLPGVNKQLVTVYQDGVNSEVGNVATKFGG